MSKILILDDDDALAQSVEDILSAQGYIVDAAYESEMAETMLRLSPYDLLILDWNMPDISGIDFLAKLRKSGSQIPVLMLTGMDSVDNKTEGLDTGADDYLTKPFNSKELVSRVKAILRRPKLVESSEFTTGKLILNAGSKQVTYGGEEIKLTRQEFLLLEFLLRNRGRVFNSEALVERAWSTLSDSSPDTVRVHMFRLRKKLEAGGDDCPIRTVVGQGYIID